MIDVFHQSWTAEIERSQVLTLYEEIKVSISYEHYLYLCHNRSCLKVLTQLRLSAHSLCIQTGRYGRNRSERQDRLCNICDSGDVEDEFHFILKCKIYMIVRRRYIDAFYYKRASMFKLCQLFKSTDKFVLNNLACYIKCAMKIRSNLIN